MNLQDLLNLIPGSREASSLDSLAAEGGSPRMSDQQPPDALLNPDHPFWQAMRLVSMAGMGQIQTPGVLPVKERIAALMESPEYLNMPVRNRLSLVKGNTQGPNPDLQNLVGRANAERARFTQLRNVAGMQGSPESEALVNEWMQNPEYLRRLLGF